jgi:hypothetical protein
VTEPNAVTVLSAVIELSVATELIGVKGDVPARLIMDLEAIRAVSAR